MAADKNGKKLPAGIVHREDGRYMGRFTYAGQRYTLYDDNNPKRLKKAMEDMRYELEHGIHGNCEKINLNKWFEEYLTTYKAPILKESTINHYRLYYRLYIKRSIGNLYIKDLKAVHIQKLYNELSGKGLKENTIRKVANILHSTLQQAVKGDLIVKNPCESAVIPKSKKEERRVLSAEEQRRFLDFIADSKRWEKYFPLFATALGTGMRIGELLALSWSDIDFRNKQITVNKTLQYIQSEKDKKCKFIVQPPKTEKSNRTIPMLDSVAKALRQYKDQQRESIIMLGDMWFKSEDEALCNLVFTTQTGNPIDRSSINRTITSIVKDMNDKEQLQAKREKRKAIILNDFSPHCLRHSFATRCFEADVKPKVIQSFMGHSTLATTMDIYTHVSEDNKKSEIEKISDVV